MSAIKDGGPAFPGGEQWRTTDLAGCVNNHARAPYNNGLSLRDYFAAKALQGICAATNIEWTDARIAADAYRLADDMLDARERQP